MSTSAPAIDGRLAIAERPDTPVRGRVSQLGVFKSEWTKLYSLRSTRYALLATVLMTIGFGIIASAATVSRWGSMTAADKASFDPLSTSLLGVSFGVLSVGVLGVMLIAGEYTTGMIRSTMTAVPKRLPVLWGKAGVYAVVAFVLAVPSALVAFFAGQAILSGKHLQIAFSHPGVAGAVLGAAGYLTLVGLFAMGLAAILRNTAAGIATFAGVMFVLPPLISILPSSIANSIDPYLPSNAGQAMMQIGQHAHTLSPGAGLAVFAGYVVAVIAAAAVLLVKRDV
ncbi:MAG: type transport system permease protein [Thermoleophilaceae bacterium]|nr:type transport system permease protein [Solirubrobacteraceae bacterium]MEA2496488.1 type transport system permease protein [Thermoleophilaceae bacterium]